MEYLIIIILSAAVAILALRYFVLKKQLKSIFTQLSEEQTKLVTVELVDSELEKVVQEINNLLEQIQQTVIKSNASSAVLKSSIADISHDMKTPLTSVIGYLQLAEKECKDEKNSCASATMEEIIKICLERTCYLNTLINDFFDLSVIESQGCTPKLESVDVAGMICEQILANYPIFEEKNITPYFENSDKAVIVWADLNMMSRVIQNLISNGVKYTSGDISFQVCKKGQQVIITVSNPVNAYVDIAHIFDRFYTQDKSRSKGSGIGLYICRQFIESMGGSINAEMSGDCLDIKVVLNSV